MPNFVMEPIMVSRIDYEKLMEIKDKLDKIEDLVEQFSNDFDLGGEVRKLLKNI